MTVHVTIELDEAVNDRLRTLADRKKVSPEELVRDVLAEHLDYDRWFRAAVEEGRASAARGELHDQEEVFAELYARMEKAPTASAE